MIVLPEKLPAAVHMLEKPFREVLARATSAVPLEIGGFLAGYVGRWEDKLYVMITEQIPVRSKSTTLTVEFLNEGAHEVAMMINEAKTRGNYIVGWYHSHPGYSCYPSRLDVHSHYIYFREFYHIGLIVDPINKQHCIFKSVSDDDYVLIPFYVWGR